jgi:hypothetical protein
MGSPALALLYLVISLCSIGSLVYYFTHLTEWDLYGYNLGFIVLIASLVYTLYMFYYELKADEPILGENINMRSSNFMIDVFSKFLFSFAFAVLLFYLILILRRNFEFPPEYDLWLFSVDLYVNLILPIFCLIDTFLITRNKSPHPVADITVIGIIIFAHCAYKAIFNAIHFDTMKIVLPIISDYVVLFLMTVNGYILYDYMIHKRNYPGEYMLFKLNV